MHPIQRTEIGSIETLQIFEAQIYASPDSIILAFQIPNQHRTIQAPFGRLEFAAFYREMGKALERVPTAEEVAAMVEGNGASER